VQLSKLPSQNWWRLVLPALLIVWPLPAGELSVRRETSPQSLAFGRYIASLEHGSPFSEPGQFAMVLEAAAPQIYKEVAIVGIRRGSGNGRSEFLLLGMQGDGVVVEEVIARYFGIEEQIQSLPRSSTAITPANYKFLFRGQVNTGGGSAYVYDITPRTRRIGLFKGQIWIDAATGAEVLLSGRFSDVPSKGNTISFVRELRIGEDGCTRITHVSFAVPILGPSELTITERPVDAPRELPRSEGSARFAPGPLH